jgi:hypothetical protein
MVRLFHSVTTSQRHRKDGFCEDSDFGHIELLELDPEEKELIVSFKDYQTNGEYIEYEGYAYTRMQPRMLSMDVDDTKGWGKKQGKFSPKTALQFVLEERKLLDRRYSFAGSARYILIGRTLYSRYCKVKDLSITTAGNLTFSHWLSIDFESHGGKEEHKLSKSNFAKIKSESRKRWEAAKPKNGRIQGDGHSIFSYPTNVKWGEKYR